MMEPVYTTVVEVEKGRDAAYAARNILQGKCAAAAWMSRYI
jgi:hypothetical protein